MSNLKILSIAGTLLAIGIALGAFGSHIMQDILSAERLATWQTAVQYQVWNALGLIGLALVSKNFTVDLKIAGYCILIGILIFRAVFTFSV